MKKSRELTSLPVLAIVEGDFVAKVHSPVINPAEGKINYLLLDGDQWFLEKKAIAYNDIAAIGNNAVTTEKAVNVKPVSKFENAVKLLQNEANVLHSRVMTKDGRMVGTVSEFFFDETSGKIIGCELTPEGGNEPAGVIPAAKIVTFGQKYLIVAEDADTSLEKEPGDHSGEPVNPNPPGAAEDTDTEPDTAPAPEESASETETQPQDPLELFSEKQRRYLLGKKVSKTIIDANGNIVATEGTVITEDIINRAMRVDKYVELTMFVE